MHLLLVGGKVVEGLSVDGTAFSGGLLCHGLVTCTQGWAQGDEGWVQWENVRS